MVDPDARVILAPCLSPDPPEEVWAYARFPRGFNNHKWCERFYVGVVRADGTLERCPCACHRRSKSV